MKPKHFMARRKQAVGSRKQPQVEKAGMDFSALVSAIRETHEQCAAQANRAVNVALTMRNWLVGSYIHEYEQNGADRAAYGEGLLDRLSERLISDGFGELTARYTPSVPAVRFRLSPDSAVSDRQICRLRTGQGDSEIGDFRIASASSHAGGAFVIHASGRVNGAGRSPQTGLLRD